MNYSRNENVHCFKIVILMSMGALEFFSESETMRRIPFCVRDNDFNVNANKKKCSEVFRFITYYYLNALSVRVI